MPDRSAKPGWQIWRFDQMAQIINDRIDDPSEAKVDRYVGLEHLDPESLKIRRWGIPSDVSATKLLFREGDIIFGRRRVYQRKLAVADFEGICSAHAMVLRARPEVVLPDFLPFFMQSDLFMNRALEISVGSLSPTINWRTLAAEEFALPPQEEQRRIAALLNAISTFIDSLKPALSSLVGVRNRTRVEQFPITTSAIEDHKKSWVRIDEVASFSRGLTYKRGQIRDAPSGSTVECVGIPCIGPDEKINLEKAVFIDGIPADEADKRRIVSGATLLIGSNGNPDRVGNCVFVNSPIERTFGSFLLQATANSDRIRDEFLFHLLASPNVQVAISSEARGSTGLRNLNLLHLKRFGFPLPNPSEQDEFCERMSRIHEATLLLEKKVSGLQQLQHIATNELLGDASGVQ